MASNIAIIKKMKPLSSGNFFLISLFIISSFVVSNAQPVYKDFSANDYAVTDYKTKIQNIPFNLFTIRLIKVSSKGDNNENAFYCRAWLKILLNDSTIDSLYFDNMVPGRGCAGLYMDDEQPVTNYFSMVKFGDYNGRTLVIDNHGKIHNIIGGKYFITRDKRYLFSIYEGDRSAIAIYDFILNKQVYYADTLGSKLDQWYFQDGRYFSLDQENDEEEVETENPNFDALFFKIRTYDVVKRQMRVDKLNFENLREENAIELQPHFKRSPDCVCK